MPPPQSLQQSRSSRNSDDRHLPSKPLVKIAGRSIAKRWQGDILFSQPIRVDGKSCLICHGDPADAPKDQIEIYGDGAGYNWSLNDTVAAFMIYVPTADAIAAVKKQSITLMLIGAAAIFLILLILWVFLDRSVVLPIVQLAQRTESFSLGENLDEAIQHHSKDEIGALAQAIERLRISLSKLLKKGS